MFPPNQTIYPYSISGQEYVRTRSFEFHTVFIKTCTGCTKNISKDTFWTTICRNAFTFQTIPSGLWRNCFPVSPVSFQDSTGMKLWKKRWFVLSDLCLFYYRGESCPLTLHYYYCYSLLLLLS